MMTMPIDGLFTADAAQDDRFYDCDILVLSPTPTYPLDAGNRKRVHAVCSELKRRGARIHFVFYPFEWWFSHVPQKHLREMEQQWDSFYMAPPTRPIQSAPSGHHHSIDEWWDESIDGLLRWLFGKSKFDAFIVNYPYLSRALEVAPSNVFKILDTHDKFSGRRELLEKMGVKPEFFYTTEDQEAIALNRANLVWAIKDEEAEFFRTISQTPVATMPHLEPQQVIARKCAEKDEDYVVFGMVGARNSVNFRNAMTFIQEVMPKLTRTLAPVKVRFGGGMCDDLEREYLPVGVELYGRFDRQEDFYADIDAIIVPLQYSTGLKIKAVEALSLGLPVISHAHAMEGIPVQHPFHCCHTMDDMAEAMIQTAFEPNRLIALRQETKATYRRLQERFDAAMDLTMSRIAQRPRIILAIAPDFAQRDTLYREHALSTLNYLRYLADVTFYVDRAIPGSFNKWCESFHNLGTVAKMILSPAAARGMKVGHTADAADIFPMAISIQTLEEACKAGGVIALWLLDLPQEVIDGTFNPNTWDADDWVVPYCRLEALHLVKRDDAVDVGAAIRQLPGMIAVSNIPYWDSAGWVESENYRQIPFWHKHLPWQISEPVQTDLVAVIVDEEALPLGMAILKLLAAKGARRGRCAVICTSEAAHAAAKKVVGRELGGRVSSTAQLQGPLKNLTPVPGVVLNLVGTAPDLSVLQEIWERKGVAWIEIGGVSNGGVLDSNLSLGGERIATVRGIFALADRIVAGEVAPRPNALEVRYGNDAGWSRLWSEIEMRVQLRQEFGDA